MRKSLHRQIILLLLAVSFSWSLCFSALALEDTIIAIVNDDIITLKDLREYLATKHMQLRAEGKSASEIEELMGAYTTKGINRLIEEKLLVDEADKQGLVVQEWFVEQRLDEIKSEYPNEQIFIEALGRDGLSISDLKNKIRDQLKVQSIIEHEIRSKIFVSPQEITKYYQQHMLEFRKPERVKLENIFITYEEDPEKAESLVSTVTELLKEKDFALVAEEYSKLPSLGIVSKGQMKPHIEEVVFTLAVGEVSSPVKTDEGFYILKVTEKIPEEQAPLEEVNEQISNLLYKNKYHKKLKHWLEQLKKEAYVEIKQ